MKPEIRLELLEAVERLAAVAGFPVDFVGQRLAEAFDALANDWSPELEAQIFGLAEFWAVQPTPDKEGVH